MESIIEQILNLVSESPEMGAAVVQLMYFFVFTIFAGLMGAPAF